MLQADWQRAAPGLRVVPAPAAPLCPAAAAWARGASAGSQLPRAPDSKGDTCGPRVPEEQRRSRGGGAAARSSDQGSAALPAPGGSSFRARSVLQRQRRGTGARGPRLGDELTAVKASLRPPPGLRPQSPGRLASRNHVRMRRRPATVRVRDVPRTLVVPTRSLCPSRLRRSIHIVALGNEGDTFHQDNRPSGLIRTYLGRVMVVPKYAKDHWNLPGHRRGRKILPQRPRGHGSAQAWNWIFQAGDLWVEASAMGAATIRLALCAVSSHC